MPCAPSVSSQRHGLAVQAHPGPIVTQLGPISFDTLWAEFDGPTSPSFGSSSANFASFVRFRAALGPNLARRRPHLAEIELICANFQQFRPEFPNLRPISTNLGRARPNLGRFRRSWTEFDQSRPKPTSISIAPASTPTCTGFDKIQDELNLVLPEFDLIWPTSTRPNPNLPDIDLTWANFDQMLPEFAEFRPLSTKCGPTHSKLERSRVGPVSTKRGRIHWN